MPRRSVTRLLVAIACLALTLTLAAGWTSTLFWRTSWYYPAVRDKLHIEGGAVRVGWQEGLAPFGGPHFTRRTPWPISWLPWHDAQPFSAYWVWPLWPIPVASAAATFFLFRASRRRRGGCSRCGYDLAGLPPGAPCPECGGSGLQDQARNRRDGTGRAV